ncbi:MAG: electron transport complex subunit RsxG [Porticoccaceae bacterium]
MTDPARGGVSTRRNTVLLVVVALAAAALLSAVHGLTRAPIAQARALAAEALLLTVVPQFAKANDVSLDFLPVPARFRIGLGSADDARVYRIQRGGEILAVIVPALTPSGYGGPIRLIAGIDRDGTLTGVRVLEHHETPGLGDRIATDNSDWILRFTGKSLTDPAPNRWQVRRDGGAFDQITGATISSRAVVRQVRRALDYFHDDRTRLLDAGAIGAPESAP